MEEEFWKFGCPSNPPDKGVTSLLFASFIQYHSQICSLVHFFTSKRQTQESEFPIWSPRVSRYKTLTVMSCRDTEIRIGRCFYKKNGEIEELCLEAIIPESQPFLLRVFSDICSKNEDEWTSTSQKLRKKLLLHGFTPKNTCSTQPFSIQHGLSMTFQFFPICIGANFSCLDKIA